MQVQNYRYNYFITVNIFAMAERVCPPLFIRTTWRRRFSITLEWFGILQKWLGRWNSHVTLLTIVARYNFLKIQIITQTQQLLELSLIQIMCMK